MVDGIWGSNTKKCLIRHPTSPFTILEPQNPWIDEFYVVRERRTTDFEHPKLGKGSSGRKQQTTNWDFISVHREKRILTYFEAIPLQKKCLMVLLAKPKKASLVIAGETNKFPYFRLIFHKFSAECWSRISIEIVHPGTELSLPLFGGEHTHKDGGFDHVRDWEMMAISSRAASIGDTQSCRSVG